MQLPMSMMLRLAVLLTCLAQLGCCTSMPHTNSSLPWRCGPWAATATPHATQRPAHLHRHHIIQQAAPDAFVQSYAACNDEDEGLDDSPITRCGTSQYAVVTYLCGKAVADLDGKLPGFRTIGHFLFFLDWMDHVVQTGSSDSCSQWPELVLRFDVNEATDPSLGHTFAVHFLPEGGMQVYQSFITHYTLHSYLESHGPLDLSGFEAFLHNIEVITNVTGSTWPAAAERAYRTNFLVSLARGGKIRVGPSKAKPGHVWGQSKASSRPIKMLAERACLAAPWHGAAAATADNPHTTVMLAILPPFFGDKVGPLAAVDDKDADDEEEAEAQEDEPPARLYEHEDYDAYGYGNHYGGDYANSYGSRYGGDYDYR